MQQQQLHYQQGVPPQQMQYQQQPQQQYPQQFQQQPPMYQNNMVMQQQPQMQNQNMYNPQQQQQQQMAQPYNMQQIAPLPMQQQQYGQGQMGYNMPPQQQYQQKQIVDYSSMQGKERLDHVQQVTISVGSKSGCSEIVFLSKIGLSFFVSADIDGQKASNTLFTVKFDDPMCLTDQVLGYFTGSNRGGGMKDSDKFYRVDHERTCCALKCLFGFFTYCVGFLFFYFWGLICPSQTKLKHNKSTLYILEYSLCASEVIIKDDRKQLRYKIQKRSDGSRYVTNFTGEEVAGLECKMLDNGANIKFPDDFDVDSKAAVILGVCKLFG